MADRLFTIHFEGDFILAEDEIWPDEDGPEWPTTDDVVILLRDLYPSYSGPIRLLDEWNLHPIIVKVDGQPVWEEEI